MDNIISLYFVQLATQQCAAASNRVVTPGKYHTVMNLIGPLECIRQFNTSFASPYMGEMGLSLH